MKKYSLSYLLLIFLISSIHAQDMSADWNMREKDRLIQTIESGDFYWGLIKPNHTFEIHQLLPKADSVHYLRLTDYDSIVCKYANQGAEKVVNAIFSDIQLAEASACTKHMRKNLTNVFKQNLIGHRTGNLVLRIELGINQYGLVYKEEERLEPLDEHVLPLAMIEESILCFDLNQHELFIRRKEQRIPVIFESGTLMTNARALSQMVAYNKADFFIPVAIEEEVGTAILDPKSGQAEVFLKTAVITGFSDKYVYYMSKDGFAQMNLKKNDRSVIISSDFSQYSGLPPLFVPEKHDKLLYLSTGKGFVMVIQKELFYEMDIDFERYNELKQNMREIELAFEEEGLNFWDYYDSYYAKSLANVQSNEGNDEAVGMEEPVAEVPLEEAVEEEGETEDVYQKSELPELNKQQEKLMNKYFDQKEEYSSIKSKLSKQVRDVLLNSEKVDFAYLPEGYKIQQHPVNKSILFIPEKAEFPILYEEDLLRIDKRKLNK